MECFLSAIPEMAKDLNTTQRTINHCLAGYNVVLGCKHLDQSLRLKGAYPRLQ